MKIGFIYGGQGSQVLKMGYDLYEKYPTARKIYDKIDEDIKDMSFYGELETISKTKNTQRILLAFQIAITEVLLEHGIKPKVLMGLSLGEYSALWTSKVLDFKDVMEIIRLRSKYMAEVEDEIESKMIAVFSDDIKLLEEICKNVSNEEGIIEISNVNTKGQIVISGEESKVLEAEKLLEKHKIRYMAINTSGAFHTSYMDEVSLKLEEEFKKMEINQETIPVIYNYLGDYNKKNKSIETIMSKQVNNRVLFKGSLEKMLEEDLDLIIEIGHKNVIRGFIKRLDRKVEVRSINTVETIEELIKEVKSFG